MTTFASSKQKPAIMPRLLMACSTVADGSGMMAAVAPLAGQMDRRGFDVRLVGPIWPNEWPVDDYQTHGVGVDVLPRRPCFPLPLADAWNTSTAVADFARAGGCCVVHVHGVWTAANAAACLRSQMLGVPYVVSPHGMLMPQAMKRSEWKKRLALCFAVRRNLELASVVHVTSAAEKDSVAAVAPQARVCIIPWGVDVSAFSVNARSPTAARVAAYVGRFLPLKGVDDLVDAWAEVKPSRWKLRFIGSDPNHYSTALQRRIDSAGLGGVVTIDPQIAGPDMPQLLRGIDLLVLPSYSENFGFVVAEALAAGVPVITTTATPWAEVQNRQCGWCVLPGVVSLADALRDGCSRSETELERMGQRGRAWMEKEFSWKIIADRFVADAYGLHE